MPLVHIDEDERYPDLGIRKPNQCHGQTVDVPQELIDRHFKALKEYDDVQMELYRYLIQQNVVVV